MQTQYELQGFKGEGRELMFRAASMESMPSNSHVPRDEGH